MDQLTNTAPAPNIGLAGVNVALMGPTGTGKTHSIGTLVETGLEVFYIGMEAGLESLIGYFADNNKPIPSNLHWKVVEGPSVDFSALQDMANKVNTLSYEALCKVVDPNKSKYQQTTNLFKTLNKFVDERTGQDFGAVSTWGNDKALVIDGMTGICQSYAFNAIGGKPVMSPSEYQVAQKGVFQLIFKLTNHCRCHFILLSHVVREADQLTGSSKLMMMTIGNALTPMIPLWFSDVILTVREGARFSWDTANALADLKTRNLPIQAGLQPDFKQIIDKWRKRNTL